MYIHRHSVMVYLCAFGCCSFEKTIEFPFSLCTFAYASHVCESVGSYLRWLSGWTDWRMFVSQTDKIIIRVWISYDDMFRWERNYTIHFFKFCEGCAMKRMRFAFLYICTHTHTHCALAGPCKGESGLQWTFANLILSNDSIYFDHVVGDDSGDNYRASFTSSRLSERIFVQASTRRSAFTFLYFIPYPYMYTRICIMCILFFCICIVRRERKTEEGISYVFRSFIGRSNTITVAGIFSFIFFVGHEQRIAKITYSRKRSIQNNGLRRAGQ